MPGALTDKQLRRLVDDNTDQAEAALKRGDKGEAELRLELARAYREVIRERESAGKRLSKRQDLGSVDEMVSAHKLAISAGRSHGNPLAEAARANGMTMTDLARKVGVSLSLLSKAMSGERSIRRIVVARIEKLTGFPAENWKDIAD